MDDMQVMEEGAWVTRAEAMRASHDAGLPADGLPALRRLMVALHALMLAMPSTVQRHFELLPEAALAKAAESHRKMKLDRELSTAWWRAGSGEIGGPKELVKAAAIQARVLDEALFQRWVTSGRRASAESLRCETSGCVVLPRRVRRHSSTARSYRRRGLLRHAIIPPILAGHPIELVFDHDVAAQPPEAEITLAAALLPDLAITTEPTEDGGFLVSACRHASGDAFLAQQLAMAAGEQCLALVWPELSVTPAARSLVAAWLRERGTNAASIWPRLVVAGSWHETHAGEMRNLATVFDRLGTPLHAYAKRRPYDADAALGPEGCVPGVGVPVIVTEHGLYSLGICRDFCDMRDELHYTSLEVDVVLVPSMGSAKIFTHHLRAARNLGGSHGARCFIVQQDDRVEGHDTSGYPAGHGYVLGPKSVDPLTMPQEYRQLAPTTFHVLEL